uniref:LRAT domain-containing protein n=1 Tax=Amphimedon queenslandica TaxID=400682 RepID=A0A1X7VD07_AMPQE
MSLSIKICLIFALVCLLSDRIYCAQLRSSSSGAGTAYQSCPNGYYCLGQCLAPRSARCTAVQSQECPSLDQSCNHVSGNYYGIQVGHAYLGFSGSKSTHDLEHRFVIYRGFAYEFGTYGVQVLDITDPRYKYANGRDLNSNGIVSVGSSSCSYEQAQMFADRWRVLSYNVIWRNCQHFERAMVIFLKGSSCSQSVLKQDTDGTNAVMNEIESILTNCSIVCCNTNSTTTSAGAGPSVHFVGLVVTIFIFAFALF